MPARQLFQERAERQVAALSQLQHPHLLPLYGHGEWEGFPYLITPYTTEQSLGDLIKQQGPWSPAEALSLVEQVTAALEYAHRQGLIHGMLTPEHLLMKKEGSFWVTGLGLQGLLERRGILPCARPSEYVITLADTSLCAPKYLAPEYRAGKPVTIRSDVYSLGVTLVELFSGSFLPNEMTAQELIWEIEQRVPPAVQPILQMTVEPDPAERFRRVSDFLSVYAELANQAAGREKMPRQKAASQPPAAPSTEKRFQQRALLLPSVEPQAEKWSQQRALSLPPIAPQSEKWSQQRAASLPPVAPDRRSRREPVANYSTGEDPAISFEQRWSLPEASSSSISPYPVERSRKQTRRNDGLPRRQMMALLAGGVVVGLAGAGGINLIQQMLTTGGGQTAKTTTVATLPNTIGQTSQPVNTGIPVVDMRVPDHRQRLLVHLPNGNFVAYKQGCTHTGVLVNYDPKTHLMVCPAHGAIFDPAKNGSVVTGPTTIPLPMVGIQMQPSGAITLI
jgi:serine/threonine protein kinase/nitrite reductase/ring-hydroxylating ferredoxin subunit